MLSVPPPCPSVNSVVNALIDTLNKQQRAAVEYSGGPLIVLAGPGTGKTRVIIARLAHLLEQGADPDSLLALTFSVKAAEEMRERLAKAIGPVQAARVPMHTFHSYGKRLLDRFGDAIGVPSNMDLLDSAMTRRMLRRLISQNDLFLDRVATGRDAVIDRAMKFIGACRNVGKLPPETIAYARTWTQSLRNPPPELAADPDALTTQRAACDEFAQMATLYELFDTACREEGLFNFDDLLTQPLKLLRERPSINAIIRDESRHIVVDEFQDVNPAQIELLRLIAPPKLPSGKPPDLCVVGDDDQAIYGFRGSDPHAFTRFAEIWTNPKTIPLTTNYRSVPHVIAAGNTIITRAAERFAPDKVIEPGPEKAAIRGGVEGVILRDDAMSGQVIAGMIADDRSKNPERPLRKYAVIARDNNTLSAIATEMDLAGLPVEIRQKITALDDQGVQDLLAWIRLLLDQDNRPDAQRLLCRPPMCIPITQIQLWAAAYAKSPEASTKGFADWVISVQAGTPGVARFAELLADFRARLATDTADVLVEHIVRCVDIAHAEDLEPRQRALRLSRLVQVLRFVRGRQQFLGDDGTLAAFWSYYNDLNESEREFEAPGDDRIAAPGTAAESDAGDRPDAVQLMTAHKSKGLEYDTVFIAKVRPRGFPAVEKESDGYELPAEFSGLRERDHADEQRRLFYVACTRAERRLVLLAKAKKGRGESTDYFIELQDQPGLAMPTTDADEWLARTGASTADALEGAADVAGADARRKRLLQREAARVRQEAFAALHDARAADAASITDVEARLARAAHLLAGIGALDSGASMPEFIKHDSPEGQRLHHIAERLSSGSTAFVFAPPQPAPLSLSYSRITEYQKCPRCYYLKYVLGYDEPKTPELAVGDIVHKSIDRFLKECAEAEKHDAPAPDLARLLAISDDEVRRSTPRTGTIKPADIARIRAQLSNYLEAFHDDAHLFRAEGAASFDYICGEHTHRINAKVDRIDQTPDGLWRIADYKTGDALKKFTEPKADDIQMGIYAMALPWLIDPTAAAEGDTTIPDGVAEYWLLGPRQRGSIRFADLKLEKVRKAIDTVIHGMLAGEWPQGKECRGHCVGLWDE